MGNDKIIFNTEKDIFGLSENNHEALKKYKALSDKGQLGCYIITKGRPLNKYEQMICRIFPYSLYAEHLWYEANGRILGQPDENGKMKPFDVEL